MSLVKGWWKRITCFDIGALLLIVIFYIAISRIESPKTLQTLSPRIYPICVLLSLAALTLFPFGSKKENKDINWISLRALLLIPTLILYAVGTVYVGIVVSTVPALITWMMIFGYRRFGVMIPLAIGFGICVRYLFVEVLGVWFPEAMFF